MVASFQNSKDQSYSTIFVPFLQIQRFSKMAATVENTVQNTSSGMPPILAERNRPERIFNVEKTNPTSMTRKTAKLCLMITISFVQFRFGFFRLMKRPNCAWAKQVDATLIMISKPDKKPTLRAKQRITVRSSAGGRVNRTWFHIFALMNCRELIGSVLEIQSVFPSSEIIAQVIDVINDEKHNNPNRTTGA